eukprot:7304097-Prymnesium_polylepis.2
MSERNVTTDVRAFHTDTTVPLVCRHTQNGIHASRRRVSGPERTLHGFVAPTAAPQPPSPAAEGVTRMFSHQIERQRR